MGYDSVASHLVGPYLPFNEDDSEFGEYWEAIDTSKFKAFVNSCCDGLNDTVIRAHVSGEGLGPSSSISFNYGLLPLKMSWDVSLLRSPELPFPDQSPAPRAEMTLGFFDPMYSVNSDGNGCPSVDQVLITDTVLYNGGLACWRTDSIFFESYWGPGFGPSPINFGMRRWQGFTSSINENNDKPIEYSLYPNPADNELTINILNARLNFTWYIINIYGEEVLKSNAVNTNKISINTSQLPAGIYFLKLIINEEKNIAKTKMIVLTH